MHQSQLGGGVIVKQIRIMGILQDITNLVCAAGRRGAGALLDLWAWRDDWRLRWRTAQGWYELHEQRLLIGHPLHRVTQYRIDLNTRQHSRLPGGNLRHPELDPIRGLVRKGKHGPIGVPLWTPEADTGGQSDQSFSAVGKCF